MDFKGLQARSEVYAKKGLVLTALTGQRVKVAYARLKQREYTMRDGVILLFVAIVLGATLKTMTSGILTIGYQDYQLKPSETIIDIGALQKEMIEKGGSMSVDGEPSRASCSE